MASERKAFKEYFDRTAAEQLATQLSTAYPELPRNRFINECLKGLESLEFVARVTQFSNVMRDTLPNDVPSALRILHDSLPEPLPNCDAVMDGWLQWPVGQFIADYGVEHFDESMRTMLALTQCFSAEFAVRPFVEHHQKRTIGHLKELTDHPSPHVRRWCSEGIRTRLPWGKKLTKLIENPKPILPILERLKDDKELYVRRSVANNLNDLSKDHPALITARCEKWYQATRAERVSLVKQALRGLIKEGDPAALAVIGFSKARNVDAAIKVSKQSVAIGASIDLTAEIKSASNQMQPLLIDYLVHYVRKNGSPSPKVFKWKTLELPPGESITLRKKQSFKQTSVREIYPGPHLIELQINGVRVAQTSLEITAK